MITGVYASDQILFKVYPKLKPSWRNEYEITDAITLLIEGGYKVVLHMMEGWWKDTGKPEDILEAGYPIGESKCWSLLGMRDGEVFKVFMSRDFHSPGESGVDTPEGPGVPGALFKVPLEAPSSRIHRCFRYVHGIHFSSAAFSLLYSAIERG